jgi:hypothetical protein
MKYCPTCEIDYEPGKKFCGHCGTALVTKAEPICLDCWTQGLSHDGRSDGSFEFRNYPVLSLAEALRILETMPVPPADEDPGDYCWPNLGFPDTTQSISRMDDGTFFTMPEERTFSLEEARQWLRGIYAAASK